MSNISVIIPYYNNEDHIQSCLESLETQTYKDFEIILVNDKAIDRTEEIVSSYMETSSMTIKHLHNQENLGVAGARNKGIETAEGEWIYFLDADDTISPFTLEYMEFVSHDTDGVITPISKFTVNKKSEMYIEDIDISLQSNATNPTAFLRKNTACGIFFKKSIIDQYHLRFEETFKIFPDWSFSIEYQKYVKKFIKINNGGFYYRGEVYDPFNQPNLSRSEFNTMFNSYCASYFDNLDRTIDIRVKHFLHKKMIERIKRYFNPDSPYINERYAEHGEQLTKIFNVMKKNHYKNTGFLMKQEIKALKTQKVEQARNINHLRKQSRIFRRLLLNKKTRARSLYDLNVNKIAVKKKLIVFESFAGKGYSDSPKYIYEYMYQHHPEFEYIWVLNQPENFDIPGPAKKVKRLTKDFYKAYAEAEFWVANARTPLYLQKKPEQYYIQTWHGTPLKRLGNDMKVVRMPGTTTPAYKYNFKKETDRWDFMVSPNHYSTDIFKSAFWMDDERMLETGYPRNDILTNHKDDVEYISRIKKQLNIPADKKVILYAPTWRDDEFIKKGSYRFELKIDLENLQERLGSDTVLLLRMHYLIASALDISEYAGFAYDVSSYPDISELYLISDLLITDYSSVFFDYGILKRPQVFFSYDLDKYKDDLRGFYLDYYTDLPGPIYKDAYSMAIALRDIDALESKYKDKINAFNERFCSLEDGQASKRIAQHIVSLSKGEV